MWVYLAKSCTDSTSSAVSEESPSPCKGTFGPSPTVKTTDTLNVYYCQECQIDHFHSLRYGMTYERCMALCYRPWTSSTEASPARTFQSQDAEKAWEESVADYFSRSSGSLARFDRDSCFWRTSQRLLFEEQSESLASFAAYGMTVDGVFYPLRTWERTTEEPDGGYWPTPCLPNNGGTNGKTKLKKMLRRTPDANMGERGAKSKELFQESLRTSKHAVTINDQIRWSTPTARDWKGYTLRNGGSICNQLKNLYGRGGKPNPDWIEWVMGYQTKWTALEDWATAWFQPKRGKRLKGSSGSSNA